jgi:hypothetical protein
MDMTCQRLSRGLLIALLCGAFLGPPPVDAQSDSSGPLSKLSVHGFLSQAYATANLSSGDAPFLVNPTSDELSLGIPEGGTTSYRTVAIQFRYDISPKDVMIIQFSSRELGNSPVQTVEDEIELDWAFYERRLTDHTSIKVGRVQIPLGIFNEIRDVGTILPFYRPPFTLYREGTFTSETVDGLVLSHTFAPESDWSVDFDVYGGEWDLAEVDFQVVNRPAFVARAEDAWGVQLWLNTPVPGLRFGAAHHEEKISGGVVPAFRAPGESVPQDVTWYSLDMALEKFVLRAEYVDFHLEKSSTFITSDFRQSYVQLGYHATEKFRIYGQYEEGTSKAPASDLSSLVGFPVLQDVDITFRTDLGFALNYLFSPNVVLKLEHHVDIDNDQFTFVPDQFPPTGLIPVVATSGGGEYSILSLSASF